MGIDHQTIDVRACTLKAESFIIILKSVSQRRRNQYGRTSASLWNLKSRISIDTKLYQPEFYVPIYDVDNNYE